MGIRITNKMMTNNSLNNLNTNKLLFDKISTQLSTKQKISRASEDPVVAIRALRLKTSLSTLDQYYSKNIPDAEAWLDNTQTALTNIQSCVSSIKGLATKATSGQYNLDQKKSLLQEYQSLRQQVYSEGNADISGRSLLTGYKTNMDLAFKAADTSAKYRISEKLSGSEVENINYVSGRVDVNASNILVSTDKEYDQNGVVNNSLYRLRLAYSDLAENTVADGTKLTYSSSGTLNTSLTVAMADSKTGYVKANMSLDPVSGNVNITVEGTDSAGGSYTALRDASGKVTISDSTGKTTTFQCDVSGNTLKATKEVEVKAVSLTDTANPDDAYLLATKDESKEKVIFIKETGELILGGGVYQSLQNSGKDSIGFTYEKTGFAKGELRPEHYFDCTNLNTGAEYENENTSQDIEYIVNFNQTITINTEAKNVFDESIGRDVDDLIAALESSIATETKKNELEGMLKDSQYSGKKEYIESMLSAVEKERTYANNKLQKLLDASITNFGAYGDKITVAITDIGSKESRLDMIKDRAARQQTNLQTLSEENIGIELSDVIVEQKAASVAYNAALSATSNILTKSLLDFI